MINVIDSTDTRSRLRPESLSLDSQHYMHLGESPLAQLFTPFLTEKCAQYVFKLEIDSFIIIEILFSKINLLN